MTVRVITGHVLAALREMPDESVHVCVSSPPYYGLRDYGIEPQVWGGRSDGCEHEWGDERITETGRNDGGRDIGGRKGNYQGDGPHKSEVKAGAFCRRCAAWRGSLGLEPTLGLFLDHLVEIFREVRRVLRKDGTCWLNIGDSYGAQQGDIRVSAGIQAQRPPPRPAPPGDPLVRRRLVGSSSKLLLQKSAHA